MAQSQDKKLLKRVEELSKSLDKLKRKARKEIIRLAARVEELESAQSKPSRNTVIRVSQRRKPKVKPAAKSPAKPGGKKAPARKAPAKRRTAKR